MNDRAIKILEFDKIREMLVHFAGSDLGRRRCAALVPSDTREQAEAWQQETEDALTRTYSKGSLSFSGIAILLPSFRFIEARFSMDINCLSLTFWILAI